MEKRATIPKHIQKWIKTTKSKMAFIAKCRLKSHLHKMTKPSFSFLMSMPKRKKKRKDKKTKATTPLVAIAKRK